MRKIIKTQNAPLAIGTYSQGVTFENLVSNMVENDLENIHDSNSF